MSGRDDKAKRYISALDDARTNGSWSEVPELIRKVTKHAPQRTCLLRTAAAENDVMRSAASPSLNTSLSQHIESLQSSIDNEQNSSEERLQVHTCLWWIHWLWPDLGNSTGSLRVDQASAPPLFPGVTHAISTWTEICLVKLAYFKGTVLRKSGRDTEALDAFQSASPWTVQRKGKTLPSPQLAYWSEQLLAQAALCRSQSVDFQQSGLSDVTETLETFRQWANFATKGQEAPARAYGNSSAHLPRLTVWRVDYGYVSGLLRHSIVYPSEEIYPSSVSQIAEFRRVEMLYESELLRSTRFPKATESNTLVEAWVEQVIGSWQILCSDRWRDEDLGQGGRNALGRNVLDILYRAAAKTFHSTLILRRLFQVHKYLTDFELAYRALDTYIELTERGRARAAKSNEAPTGQDDDETVLRTISEGIESLCSFGSSEEARKAYGLCEKIGSWLEQLLPGSGEAPAVNGHHEGDIDGLSNRKTNMSPETLEVVYRAMGIAKAQWARWTPFSEYRSSLQAEAVTCLREAVSQSTDDVNHLESTYALGVTLAEMREINQAVDVVKSALLNEHSATGQNKSFLVERKLVALWHLLALLLTARQDFDTASQTCAAAFDQFTSNEILFGSGRAIPSSKMVEEKSSLVHDYQRGLVDDMGCSELQRMTDIQITELALTEVAEGAEEAVNRCNELLVLFSRLFGHLGLATEDRLPSKTLDAPQSSTATVKSLRGSIFGRRKMLQSGETISEATTDAHSTTLARPATQTTEAPSIQVTDVDARSPNHKHHLFRRSEDKVRSHHDSRHAHRAHHREGSLSKMIRSRSKNRNPPEDTSPQAAERHSVEFSQTKPIIDDAVQTPKAASAAHDHLQPEHGTDQVPAPSTSLTSASAPKARQALQPKSYNEAHPSNSAGIEDRSPHAILPSEFHQHPPSSSFIFSPAPRFPKAAQQKHALGILTKIWLVIATLYRRAHLFDDAHEACDEAAKSAQKIEALVGTSESSARAFADPGWGGIGKSSDEIWADVFCERAELTLATAHAAHEKGLMGDVVDHERIREAVEQFEQCLMFFPNHAKGIVGLSNVLLDVYERKINLARRVDGGVPQDEPKERIREKRSAVKVSNPMTQNDFGGTSAAAAGVSSTNAGNAGLGYLDEDLKKTPENLNRLAARDRAYGLLSTLTKLGTGWDDSEAWFALARAHELGGEVEKAKEILWWCVELEDRRPIRHWRNLGCTGYVL